MFFKRIVKFDGLEPRCCEDIKAIVAPDIGLKSFGVEIWCGMCPPYFLRFSQRLHVQDSQ